MSRLMSVAFTEAAVRDRSKTVTRRLGWRFLKPGDRLTLCRKVMGRKADEPLVRIAEVEVVSVRRERLFAITDEDARCEGFAPDRWAFIDFFTEHMKVSPSEFVTRIEWRYLTPLTLDGCQHFGCQCDADPNLCCEPLADGRYCSRYEGHEGVRQ